MKSIKYISTVLLVTILLLGMAGCGNTNRTKYAGLSKSQKEFAKERGFDPTDIPGATEVNTMNRDGIDITVYSQFGTLDVSGAVCMTSQYMDSENGIDQIEVYYYFMWQELDEIAVRDIAHLDVMTIGDKDYLYAAGPNNDAHLYYPIDNGHFLDLFVSCVNHWDRDASISLPVKTLRELMDEKGFAEMIKFDVSGAGVLSKDIRSYGNSDSDVDYPDDNAKHDNPDGMVDFEIYMKEPMAEEVLTENGITYVKNQLVISAVLDTKKDVVEKLGEMYGFEIVGMIEITSDFQIEFTEDKSLSELEAIAEEFGQLDWISMCYLNTVSEIGID